MAVDPYTPPRAVRQDLDFAHGGPLRLNTKPGLAACIAVGCWVGMDVLTLVMLLQPVVPRADVIQVLGSLQTVSRILPLASVIAFLMWQHSAVGNVAHLGRQGVSWSPATSVGYWFVPIANIFHGHRVASELWRASNPEGAELDSRAWKLDSTPTLVTGWWIACLVAVAARYFGASVWVAWLLLAAKTLAGVLMILVVRGIDQRQVTLARLSYELEEQRERRRLKKLRKEREAAAAKAEAG